MIRDYPFYTFCIFSTALVLALFVIYRLFNRWVMRRKTKIYESIVINDQGIFRTVGKKTERAAWTRLVKVEVVTNSLGPFSEDVWWLFHQDDGTGAALPNSAPQIHQVMDQLSQMPGYLPEEVIKAMSCATDHKFLVWTRIRP